MFTSIDAFLEDWKTESAGTAKLMEALTDASLARKAADDHRTLGRIAWHIVTTFPEMMGRTGLGIGSVDEHAPVPSSAAEIAAAYRKVSEELASLVRTNWTDESLKIEDEMYGGKWARGVTLLVLVRHEIHHRGQMTILMRQAGLTVPGVYGPAREDWAQWGMNPPEV